MNDRNDYLFESNQQRILREQILRKRRQRKIANHKRLMRNRIIAVLILTVLAFVVVKICMSSFSKAEEENTVVSDSKVSQENKSYSRMKSSSKNNAEVSSRENNSKSTKENKTVLYDVQSNTPFYSVSDSGEVSFDHTDGVIEGLYTGTKSTRYSDYLQIDYKDGYVLIDINNALPMNNARVLPVGVISQFNQSMEGYSACGVACLHMMQKNFDAQISDSKLYDYTELMKFAEANGYADQGSLMSQNGGISCEQMQRLANDVYGLNLKNAYNSSENSADTVKKLIDDNKQVIALCKFRNGKVSTDSGVAHFILVTGYIENDGKTYFLYANSFYEINNQHGNAISYIGDDVLNQSINAQFDEPNAVMYIG